MANDPIARLRSTGPDLAPGLSTDLTHVPPGVLVPALMALLNDTSLRDDPVGGYAPVHAARWLGRLGAVQAAPTLAEVMGESEPEDLLHEACRKALTRLGPPAVIAVLAAWEQGMLDAVWAAVTLGDLGARGASVRPLWRAALMAEPFIAAEAVLAARDTDAIDLVEQAAKRADHDERELVEDALSALRELL